ncbi:ABC transporter ATP-binding protein [Roseivivax sediminis]|uniref:Peptide/nickel transport system ATP-binding protein n=1 Tax=Roseivivax sediminis TaxID=936889 RepID=A0A1I1VA61_9RHOB|nr:dipeptide ABC transporter ATP-binding protein [Roseivivax sediminis]SFD79804.1 peptide/nickel transport system ATP-binding protein [Roseivivax sediminis]
MSHATSPDTPRASAPEPLLRAVEVRQHFPVRRGFFKPTAYVKAVNGVSFEIAEGETFGLVGESGCGKSTLGRTLLRLVEPTDGACFYRGENIFEKSPSEFARFRRELQMVFQDPYSSLNPKMRVGDILEEAMKIHGIGTRRTRTDRVIELLETVGLSSEHYFRFPHEFSGGQRQRIGLARALSLSPKVVICDETVSALDVSIQAQVLNLMKRIRREFDLSYLFISHDLGVVKYISDRIGVMYLGNLVEVATAEELFESPKHPYTQALISALPKTNPRTKKERIKLTGEVPSPLSPPSGCCFHTRCPHATEICRTTVPASRTISDTHKVACHLYEGRA